MRGIRPVVLAVAAFLFTGAQSSDQAALDHGLPNPGGQAMVPVAGLPPGMVRPVGRPHITTSEAQAMIGLRVVNRDGDVTGEIVDFVLSGPGGTPQSAVIATGGFLGFGRSLHVVPVGALSADPNRSGTVLLDMVRADLEAAQPFKYGTGVSAMVGRR
ncbi:MAG TPA: PRC-barrel domain-containing protein [Azospirillaceae bacterium]|nr:PRC-barrel domain-containing protein [Azospirillaceae bacterium]